MDPSSYQQMMVQALMGGQPGQPPSGQNPSTPYGQAFITGNPTVPGGGMLGNSSYQTINPMSPQGGSAMPGQPDPNQLQQSYQNYSGMTPYPYPMGQDGGGGGAEGR